MGIANGEDIEESILKMSKDAIMASLGMFGGPVGIAISTAYFLYDTYEHNNQK